MRKKVLGLMMAALAVSTIGAFAQTENKQNATCETNVECVKAGKDCSKNKECKKDKKARKGERKGEGYQRKARVNLFEGIELTATQQQQLDALKAERKANKEAAKKADKEARAAQKKQFDEKVAQILTPEQYAVYQSNSEKMKAQKKDKMHKKVKHIKDGKQPVKAMKKTAKSKTAD